jgi:hypothetical protein
LALPCKIFLGGTSSPVAYNNDSEVLKSTLPDGLSTIEDNPFTWVALMAYALDPHREGIGEPTNDVGGVITDNVGSYQVMTIELEPIAWDNYDLQNRIEHILYHKKNKLLAVNTAECVPEYDKELHGSNMVIACSMTADINHNHDAGTIEIVLNVKRKIPYYG